MNTLARSRWESLRSGGALDARANLLPNSMKPESGNQMRKTSGPGGLEEEISAAAMSGLGGVKAKAGLCDGCEAIASAFI